jgi:type II secretory pathway predicted ATPase ExeA
MSTGSDFSDVVPLPTNNGKHIPELRGKGAQYVLTAAVKEALVRIDEAVKDHGVVILHGDNGLGKSVAAQQAVDKVAKRKNLDVIKIESSVASDLTVFTLMLANTLGVPYDGSLRHLQVTRWRIGAALKERTGLILWIDEVGNLHPSMLRSCRAWHDLDGVQWTLVLSGDDKFWERLPEANREVASRKLHAIGFKPFTEPESIKFAQELHPRLKATSREQLADAHAVTGGIARQWAQLLAKCLEYTKTTTGGFDKTCIDAATAAIGPPMPPRETKRPRR